MGIIEIAAIVLFVVLVISVFNAEEDWAVWTGLSSGAGLLICIMCGVAMEDKQPKTIETIRPPQIDTIITIKNQDSDTTYVYTFIKKEKEQ